MYIEGLEKKSVEDAKSSQLEDFYRKSEKASDEEVSVIGEGRSVLNSYRGEVIAHWKAPEFETFERDKKWSTYVLLSLIAIVAYAVYMNSPIMAITFIMIGVVGYLYISKEARELDFAITHEGIIAGRDIYLYENIRSFWIFYEPDGKKVISLHMRSSFIPFLHMPIHEEDPSKLRSMLVEYIPEIKQEPSIVDSLERFLKI